MKEKWDKKKVILSLQLEHRQLGIKLNISNYTWYNFHLIKWTKDFFPQFWRAVCGDDEIFQFSKLFKSHQRDNQKRNLWIFLSRVSTENTRRPRTTMKTFSNWFNLSLIFNEAKPEDFKPPKPSWRHEMRWSESPTTPLDCKWNVRQRLEAHGKIACLNCLLLSVTWQAKKGERGKLKLIFGPFVSFRC